MGKRAGTGWGLLLLIFIFGSACSDKKEKNPHVIIETKFGKIEAELYPQQAPKTVGAFLSYVDSGFYKNSLFYRVLNDGNQPSDAYKAELIQGGIWRSNYKKSQTIKGVPHESTAQTHILHKDGVLSLARLEPGTGTTEFFICIGDQSGLDFGGENNPDGQGYAAFGKVVKGMDIVERIHRQPDQNQTLYPPVAIYNITRK
ncbi:MAG: peptidylprolyl isomerase [Williamsia sp.]|nr:peptidylprolyl isomerase [Williamsia sp.]